MIKPSAETVIRNSIATYSKRHQQIGIIFDGKLRRSLFKFFYESAYQAWETLSSRSYLGW
jgi:hypothetical protein